MQSLPDVSLPGAGTLPGLRKPPAVRPVGASLPRVLGYVATSLGTFGLLTGDAGFFGAAGAALFLLLWLIVLAVMGPALLLPLARRPVLLVLPALILASTLWSTTPLVSLRAAVQYALTVCFALLVSRLLSLRGFMIAVLPSLLATAILSLVMGRYVRDGLGGDLAFVGIAASKNSFAFFMLLLVIMSTSTALDRGQPVVWRLLGAAGLLLSAPLLFKARSAGALVTVCFSFGALLAALLISRMRVPEQRLIGSCALLLVVPCLILLAILAQAGLVGDLASDFLTRVLGKSTTLTGRTTLWQHATAIIERQPLLGLGYYAFWQQGNPHAEGLWRMFQIGARMGFHFHNLYYETAVGLGLTGIAALVLLLLSVTRATFRLCLTSRSPASAGLVALLVCFFLRSFVEVDIIYPLSTSTFLFFAMAGFAAQGATPGLKEHPSR